MHGSHNVSCGSAIIGNAIVRISLFLRGAIAVEGRRRRAASASNLYNYIIYIYIYTDALAVLLVYVGLTQACPNNIATIFAF